MIHTLTEVDRLIELAIIQRSELKKLVDSLPELRTHLSIEIEKNVEQIEPHLRAELEVFLSARAKDENAKLGEMLQSKIETLCDDLETTTAAKYSAITLYKEKVIDLEKIAEKKITEAGERIGVEVPAQVEKLVEEKFARFPRAGEIDQLRKEFAEPKGLNPRGKWESGVTYYKLDLVGYNGDSYVANEETTQKPSRTSTKWTLNAARGAAGSGNNVSIAELISTPADGQILIGSNGGYVNADITAGDGIAISTAAGFIEISADGGTNYQGTWDAATNNPALTSSVGTKGYYYVVNVDGSTNLNGITDWKVGDWAIYNGSVWQKVDNSESVTSVFGRVGSITAVAGDYSATQITNTAAGSITATNVQDAINELDGEKLAKASNLSDVASVTTSRTNLGVTATGADTTYAYRANNLNDLASVTSARTNLGLGSAALESATYFLQVANNLSDVASVALARTNLGLGNSATRDVGTTAGTVAAGDDARFTDARTPTGPAGGDLTGTYPNPSLTISGVTAGGYGSASSAVVITLDSKGRATSASAVNIQIAESQVTNLVTDLASKIPSTEKGANSGVATLDSGGKIPLTQLPDSILGQVTYMGTWNAATNSPTLANPPATTTLGDYYIVTTGGTFASISFAVGDWIISNGADGWAKVDNTDAVASVFGRTGTVTATNGDYTASNITNVPAGGIVATEVQAAINELDGDKLAKASNLSDLVSPSTARTNLGLGSAATQNDTYFLQVANNLSDLVSVTTARSNLGLGTMAVQNAASVSITGGSITGITDLAVADGGTGVSTTPANGQLLIGNGTGYTVANLTAGTGVTITNSSGGISIATTGAQSAETLTATVTNAESTTITKGQVVYAFGATGNRMSVKLANNSADATSAKTLGIVSDASIAANGTGTITLVGVVDGLTLGSYADGDQLYLGATAGSLTNVKPYAPNHLVYVGIVERANNGNGELYVRVQNGYELNELHDVQITTTPLAGALLVYDATNALWKAARLTAGTNIAITNADASVTVGITGVIAGTNGGTGVNNGANTITIAGNVTHAGAFTQTFTATANTSLTLPVTGTLATLAGSEALSNKTITASAFNGTVGATTPSTGAFTTLSATRGSAGVVATLLSGNAAQSPYISFGRASEDLRLQIAAATNDLFTGTVAGDFAINSNASIWFGTAGNPIAKVSSTGLAVTGNVSATGYLGAFSGGDAFCYVGTSGSGGEFGYIKWKDSNDTINLGTSTGGDTLTITEAGNVGIGVTPVSNAGIVQLIRTNSTGLSDIGIFGYGSAETYQWVIGPSTQSNNNGIGKMWRMRVDKPSTVSQGSSFTLATYTGFDSSVNGNYVPSSSWSDRLVIDQIGNVGIGVTPSAWGPTSNLQLKSGVNISWSGQDGYLAANQYYNGSSSIYIANGYATQYAQEAGVHKWFRAPSGTAGNAITFTQAMTLDASGSLALGRTSATAYGTTTLSVDGAGGGFIDTYYAGTRKGYMYSSSGAFSLATVSTTPLTFETNGTERARIDSSGKFGIGLTNPSYELEVNGTITCQGYLTRAGFAGTAGSNRFNIQWTGSANLWIDTTNLGAIQISSDYRIKKNIQTQTASALDRVMQLRPVTYELTDYNELFKADGIVREGFIAHEVQEVIPSGAEGTKDEENRVQNLRVDAILSVTVKALQELNANLVAQVAALSQRLAALENS